MTERVTATVDLAALRHNLRRVRDYAPGSRVMAAVKADAYGHGAIAVSRALEAAGIDALAVACMEEAQKLREARVRTPVTILEGVISADEAALAAYEDLQIVVHDFWQLDLLEAMPQRADLQIWFKIDTGMHRLGFPPEAIPRLRETLGRNRGWEFQGWMTHLANADDPSHPSTPAQIRLFDEVLAGAAGPRSIANSAGLIAWPNARRDWVRPGLMLYGASPMPGQTADSLGLRPALHLQSRIIARRDCDAGSAIGYGSTFVCPERMPIGVVAVGYADGMPRCLPNGTPVLVRGRRTPIAGRVSMDMITIDLRNTPEAEVEDRVTLWGPGLPAEEIASLAGTLAYELFCGLTNRVRYHYLGS